MANACHSMAEPCHLMARPCHSMANACHRPVHARAVEKRPDVDEASPVDGCQPISNLLARSSCRILSSKNGWNSIRPILLGSYTSVNSFAILSLLNTPCFDPSALLSILRGRTAAGHGSPARSITTVRCASRTSSKCGLRSSALVNPRSLSAAKFICATSPPPTKVLLPRGNPRVYIA